MSLCAFWWRDLFLDKDPLRFVRDVRVIDVHVDHQLAVGDGPLPHCLRCHRPLWRLRGRHVSNLNSSIIGQPRRGPFAFRWWLVRRRWWRELVLLAVEDVSVFDAAFVVRLDELRFEFETKLISSE